MWIALCSSNSSPMFSIRLFIWEFASNVLCVECQLWNVVQFLWKEMMLSHFFNGTSVGVAFCMRTVACRQTDSYKWTLEDLCSSMESLCLICQHQSRNKPSEQFVYLQLTEGPLEEVSVSVTTIGPQELDRQHKSNKARFRINSLVIPVIIISETAYNNKKNHSTTKGDPEDFHLLAELVRTHSVPVAHFSSTSVGWTDWSINSHSVQDKQAHLDWRGVAYNIKAWPVNQYCNCGHTPEGLLEAISKFFSYKATKNAIQVVETPIGYQPLETSPVFLRKKWVLITSWHSGSTRWVEEEEATEDPPTQEAEAGESLNQVPNHLKQPSQL